MTYPEFSYDDHYLPELGEPSHPYDSWPTANGTNRYAPPEKMLELESANPRPEEEEAADWFNQEPNQAKEKKTVHHKMFEIATSKYNPFAVGGSESIRSIGGSENASKK